jgi:large subunit ribosomal protein L22
MKLVTEIKYIRMSPKKLKFISGKLTGMDVNKAQNILTVGETKAARLLKKIILSAKNNAVNNNKINENDLIIKTIEVTKGPAFKRWHAVSRGMAHQYKKRTCNIKVLLEQKFKKPEIMKNKSDKKKIQKDEERSKSGTENKS